MPSVTSRFYDRVRHPAARSLADEERTVAEFDHLRGHKYCLLVTPCTARGKPLGPPAEGRARVLEQPGEIELAEAALKANYGLGRRLYEGAGDALRVKAAYLEVTPALVGSRR